MRSRSVLPTICGIACTGWVLVAGATQTPQPPSIEPSSGEIVGRLGTRPFLHEGRVQSIALLDDGRRVVSVDERAVSVWGMPNGELQFRRAHGDSRAPWAGRDAHQATESIPD
jgi:hypothetical protein